MVKAKYQQAHYAKNPKYGDLIKTMASVIEMTYESFGITVRVMDVTNRENDVEFGFEVALGSSLENITKLHKDLAMALASPTGDVEIEAPIPGTYLVALRVPITSSWVDAQVKKLKRPILTSEPVTAKSEFPKTFRDYFAVIFYIIAGILDITVVYLRKLGNYIEGRDRSF